MPSGFPPTQEVHRTGLLSGWQSNARPVEAASSGPVPSCRALFPYFWRAPETGSGRMRRHPGSIGLSDSGLLLAILRLALLPYLVASEAPTRPLRQITLRRRPKVSQVLGVR